MKRYLGETGVHMGWRSGRKDVCAQMLPVRIGEADQFVGRTPGDNSKALCVAKMYMETCRSGGATGRVVEGHLQE